MHPSHQASPLRAEPFFYLTLFRRMPDSRLPLQHYYSPQRRKGHKERALLIVKKFVFFGLYFYGWNLSSHVIPAYAGIQTTTTPSI